MTWRMYLIHVCNPLHVYCRVMDLVKWYERRIWPTVRRALNVMQKGERK
jgi:hypothetical protein